MAADEVGEASNSGGVVSVELTQREAAPAAETRSRRFSVAGFMRSMTAFLRWRSVTIEHLSSEEHPKITFKQVDGEGQADKENGGNAKVDEGSATPAPADEEEASITSPPPSARLSTGDPDVPADWKRLEVTVRPHPKNGLGVVIDAGVQRVARIWELGGVAQGGADLRVGDRILTMRCARGEKATLSVQTGRKSLKELLTTEPLVHGTSGGGWVLTVARDPAAPEPQQAEPTRTSLVAYSSEL